MRGLSFLAPLTAIALAVSASAASAAPGGLDPSFGQGGIVVTNGFGTPGGAVLQPSTGDILVVVDSNTGGPSGVLRYLPNGTLDPTFGSGGFAPITSSTLILSGGGIALQSNGQILVSASALTTASSQVGVAVARLNSNGSLDATFGHGGIAFTAVPGGPSAAAVVQQPSNGDILVGGSFLTATYRSETTTGVVVRFTPSGQADSTFGSGGVVSSTALGGIQTLGVDSSDDAFVLPATAELSPTGAIDPSVASTPTITASSQGGPNAFVANGKSVRVTSAFIFKGNTEVETQRFLANGSLDATFPTAEFHYVTGQTARDSARAVAVEPNGDILVGGSHWFGTAVFGLARLTAAGALDPTFGSGGVLTTTVQGDESVGSLLIQNNEIVAVGFTENNSTGVSGVALARYFG